MTILWLTVAILLILLMLTTIGLFVFLRELRICRQARTRSIQQITKLQTENASLEVRLDAARRALQLSRKTTRIHQRAPIMRPSA